MSGADIDGLVKTIATVIGVGWGFYSWVLRNREKVRKDDKNELTEKVVHVHSENLRQYTEVRKDIQDLQKLSTALVAEVSRMRGELDLMNKTTKEATDSMNQSSEGVIKLVMGFEQKMRDFGRVIVKD